MNEPLEKYPMNIENLGNTSSKAFRFSWMSGIKRQIKFRETGLSFRGFGGGLTYGASLLQW